jgi:hypothetical protein
MLGTQPAKEMKKENIPISGAGIVEPLHTNILL